MRVPVGMRTVVVSGGRSWAREPSQSSRLAAPAKDKEARKLRRLWSVCMTVPLWEHNQSIALGQRSPSALENLADINAHLAVHVGKTRSVAHQPTRSDQLAGLIH